MKLSLFVVISLMAFSAFAREEDVLVLTQRNFETAITENELILVAFYAPWCRYSQELLPEYAKAAGILAQKSSPFKLAKVDATVEVSLANKFGVDGFPTLIFFQNGKPMQYNGGRTAETIIYCVERNFVVEPTTARVSSGTEGI